ncbi:MAG: Na+/H+ antiporter subunit E [Bacteroidales bacterium]|nr:Na+/H+ antiporter subunit E [Bacteroidales bacterium]
MKNFVFNIFLAFIWVALTMKFTLVNILFGFILGYLTLWFTKRKESQVKYFRRFPNFIIYIFFFIAEVIKGSVRIGYEIITPEHKMNPGIIAVPLDAKSDIEITILANSITLTPGTISIALSDDRKTLYVYNMYLNEDPEKSIQEIKNGLEHKLLEVLR